MKSSFHRQLRRIFGYALLMLGFAAYSAPKAGASVSSITIDAASGEVLSSSAADTLRYPASLTKVMTLYITFDALEKGIMTVHVMAGLID